jgi:transposase
MTHPGVGPVTALATDVFLGDPARFSDGKAVASYVGMIPREYSSGPRQRLGALSGIRLWIMLRDQITYDEFCRRGARPAS